MSTTVRVHTHPDLGDLVIEVLDGRLVRLAFPDAPPQERGTDPAGDAVLTWLDGWLGGADAPLPVPLNPAGTPFQHRVWAAIGRIPRGTTRTYGALAAELGTAPRAVGRATGANPVLIAVPCHRVVGAADAAVGYAGGLARKRWLLDHERPTLPLPFPG